MTWNNLGSKTVTNVTKVSSYAPLILSLITFWNIAYVGGYYIQPEGNMLYGFPMNQPWIITFDSTTQGQVMIMVDYNPMNDKLTVEYKGELPTDIRTYTHDGYFMIETPLPANATIHMEYTAKYHGFRAVNIATNTVFAIFGINGKITMESMVASLPYVSVILLGLEWFVHRYNKKHNQMTVINYYKIQILIIKQKVLILKNFGTKLKI